MFNLAKIELTAKNNPKTTTGFYIADVSQEQKLVAGTLFILIEIGSVKAQDIKLINFLFNVIPQQYYQNKKFRLREQLGATPIEDILESGLAETNKKLKIFCAQNRIKLTGKNIQIIVGAIYENLLVLSTVGSVKALLFTFANDRPSEKNYQTFNIIQTAAGQQPLNLEANLFTNILAGPLPGKSFVLLGNEALFEYLSQAQIAKIISTLPPASAAEQIKNMLAAVNAYISFVGLILKSRELGARPKIKITGTETPPLASETIGLTSPQSQTSIVNLNKTEEITEKLLMPTGLIKLKKISRGWLKIFNFFPKKPKARSLSFAKKQAKNLNLAGQAILSKLLLAAKKSPAAAGQTKNALIGWRQKLSWQLLKEKIRSIRKTKKIYLAIGLIAIILFAVNVYRQKQKNQKIAQEAFYANISQRIEQKLNQTEASLLYNNKNKARRLLAEINELLKQMPRQTTEQKKKLSAYEAKFAKFDDLIKNITTIKTVEAIANLKNLDQQAQPGSLFLGAKQNLFITDQKKGNLYQLDLNTKIASLISLGSSSVKLKYPSAGKQGYIYYFNDSQEKNIIRLNPANQKTAVLALPANEQKTESQGLASYGNRLYLLAPAQNQIKRFNILASRLSAPQNWLKSKADISRAIDIDIDGFVYVLLNNGQLIRFLRGRQTNFSLERVDPPLTAPKKANIYLNSNYIYILDAQKPRLVVYDKKGKFLAQIKFLNIKNITDFAIDEKKSLIYILSGTNIYQAPWPKLTNA